MTSVLTTIWGEPEWERQVTTVDRRVLSRRRYLWTVFREARSFDVLLVVGSLGARDLYIDLIAAGLVKLRPRRRPAVVISDATWETGSAALAARLGPLAPVLPALSRLAIRLIDHRRTTYCVLSTAERETFSTTWGIPVDRVAFTPFKVTLFDHLDDETTDGDYLFAGGESLRDHQLLLDAVRDLDVRLHLAAGNAPPSVPPNVSAGRVPHEEFIRLLLGCRAVVVPLEVRNRSAGQQTYLNAMAAGKPVIVTEAPGVTDYVTDGETGFVVPPHPAALRERIRWVLDPANAGEVARIAEKAREVARERYSPEAYGRTLLALAEDVTSR